MALEGQCSQATFLWGSFRGGDERDMTQAGAITLTIAVCAIVYQIELMAFDFAAAALKDGAAISSQSETTASREINH